MPKEGAARASIVVRLRSVAGMCGRCVVRELLTASARATTSQALNGFRGVGLLLDSTSASSAPQKLAGRLRGGRETAHAEDLYSKCPPPTFGRLGTPVGQLILEAGRTQSLRTLSVHARTCTPLHHSAPRNAPIVRLARSSTGSCTRLTLHPPRECQDPLVTRVLAQRPHAACHRWFRLRPRRRRRRFRQRGRLSAFAPILAP